MPQSHKLGDVPSARDPTGLPEVARGRKIGKMTRILEALAFWVKNGETNPSVEID